MPLYEYSCQRCGKTFEVIQKFSDEPLTVHEGCGGAVERLLSPPALQFKGTGWYVTDYARGGKSPSTNGSSSKSEKASAPKPKADAKAETKPASSSKDK